MIDLTVKTLDSQNHAFSLDDDQITVRGFKEYIAESVAVPADSQRLIYCGRVLQDEKKLNDYDVNGKVIHLVQRAPPQAGQRSSDSGQAHAHNHGQGWQNPQRSHYRVTRAQMHSNAMYVGAMSVPAEIVEGHGLPVPQLSNTLSNSRLIVARRMLDRVNEIVDRLDDPSRPPPNPSSTESQPVLATQVQELETEQEDNNGDSRASRGARLAQATAAAIAAALSAAGANNVTILGGTSDEGNESTVAGETHDSPIDTQQQQTQQQQQQQQQHQPPLVDREGSTSTADGQSNRRTTPQFPRPPQMAELLERLNSTQDRLRPYIERYRVLMFADPPLPPGSGLEGVEENQRIVDGVSESLHYMSHACHALSDIIVDMGQQSPRNLRCRPILLPFQVEAHISLHGRNANNNNTNEEASDTANVLASDTAESSEPVEVSTEDVNQQQESDNMAQPQAEQQQQRGQEQAQSPFGTVFNLQNNVEVLMEVSPENNIETAAGTGPSQNNENNNNNNNGRISGTATFPWGSAPPPEFIRNIMQAVAGHVVQGGITTTTVTTRNPPATAGQSVTTSLDSGTSNAGQSTQARSNVGTHPTTATQTRSTSRPHVFHQHPHPLGVGMGIGQGLDFDPFLPCNSHHVRRTPSTTPNTVNATPQAARPNHTATTERQTEVQTANTSTVNSSTNSTDATSSTSSQATNNNPFITFLQQTLGGTSGQPQASISINSNVPELAESLGNIMQMLGGRNIHVGIVGDGSGNSIGGGFTVADLLQSGGLSMDSFTSHETDREENFLVDLTVLMAQNMTLEGLIRLRLGQREPIAYLRRPLQEFFQYWFSSASSPEVLQEEATERLLSQIRPYLQNLLATEEDVGGRSGSRIDICATVEALLSRHTREILRLLFDSEIDDNRFGQEILSTANTLGRQLCAVLRYSVRGGQAGLEAIASRFMTNMLDRTHSTLRQWMLNSFIVHFRTYSLRVPQPPDSEILPLLVYKDVPSQTASSTPLTVINQTSQPQSEHEPMETETVEERSNNDILVDNGEEIPETFPGHEALPSDWVPIIARDGVRQRRQLQMQGMTNTGVTPFSDAYLGGLPTKRRKLIEQQKSRLLVSPTPNHSVITASVERLVREGMGRAGVQEVEGAAVAVAADPGVRRTFGRAIRDCLNPRRYGTPDFPDPLRFPNATKYFTEKETPPK